MPKKDSTTATEAKTSPLLQARNAATRRLIEAHKAEHDELYVEEAENRGVTYTPEPTAEEKAAAELDRLIAENPHLEDRLRERFATSKGDDQSDSMPDLGYPDEE